MAKCAVVLLLEPEAAREAAEQLNSNPGAAETAPAGRLN
jgi:hypothetical protein